MAWNDIKVNVPGVGERAYVFSHWVTNNSVCTLTSSPSYQCIMLESEYWAVGRPLDGVYPAVGDWVTIKLHFQTSTQPPMTSIQCYEVREIIDETTFNNGTCTACPATSVCGANCAYTNTCGQTSAPTCISFGILGTWPFTGYIGHTGGTSNNCDDCIMGIPTTSNPPSSSSSDCCGPHGVLHAGRTTEVFPPTNIGSGWMLPDNNIIPILPDDIGLPYCGFRGLNEPISNGNLIVSPIDLWDDPAGWNQSSTTPQTTNSVDVHSFNQLMSTWYPYYDKISTQPLSNFLDGIITIPITGHTSLTTEYLANVSNPPNPLPPYYQEDLRGDGCPCSGENQTAIITNSCAGKTFFDTSILGDHPSFPGTHYSHMGSGQPPNSGLYNTGVMDLWLTAHTTTPVDNMTFDGGPAQQWTMNPGTVGCPAPGYAVGSGHDLNTEPLMFVTNFGKKPSTTYYAPDAGYPTNQYPGNMVTTTTSWGSVSKQPWQNGYETWEMKIGWLNNVSTQEGWLPPYMGLPFTTTMNHAQVHHMMQDIMSDQVAIGNILETDWSGVLSYNNPNCQWPCNLLGATSVRMQHFQFCECTVGTSSSAPTTEVMLLGGFELKEKYVDGPVGTRITNVLASGSWDNIRNFLWGCGMPNTIMDYDNARPWFESNANSAAMGLQTSTNPTAYPDNAANRVSIFNDVYLVNVALNTRCPSSGSIAGCTDGTATNYDPNATENCDGTNIGSTNTGWNSCCTYIGQGCGGAVCWDCDPINYTCFVSPLGPYTSLQDCNINCTDCSCIKVIGTGHTGGYHWTNQTQCDTDCCNGPSIKICDVLIVGDDEGVLHYDVTTNVATHLFSDNSYDLFDIAVGYDKLWIYTQCFIAGTMIETPDGKMAIEQIKTGDIVKTFNTETSKVETSTVTETFIHPNNSNRLIINNKINTTLEHPFYINGEWVDAGDLKVGDELLHIDGSKHKITSIKTDTSNQTVYNFEVEGTHTYFAEEYLVHNKQNQTNIKEYDITLSPFTLTYNRIITVPSYNIGKGLTFYGPNKLVCANTEVEVVDITPNPTNTGTLSTLFSLPSGYSCTGDLLYTGSVGNTGVGMFLVLYNSGGFANPPGATHKIGKFTVGGQLIDEATIPNTVLTGTSYFDSLFVDANTDAVYGITNDARVYELQQNPILQFAPVPTHSSPIPFANNVTKTVHGADNVQMPGNMAWEMSCASGITAPISYNCQINPGLGLAGCIDPGNGTGTYTGITALADCQNQSPTANPPGCIVSWSCDPGQAAGNCQSVTTLLPWPNIYNQISALSYIAHQPNNLQYTALNLISFENGLNPQPGQCYVSSSPGSGTHPQWRIDYFKCTAVSSQPMYVWAYFIQMCINAGVPNISLLDTMSWVEIKINNHFGLPTNTSPLQIYRIPCICTAQPCDCYPVLGSGGQYTTESACDAICCPPAPCKKCCKDVFGNVFMTTPNTFPCQCPGLLTVQIPCQPHTCYPTVICALGYHWSYTACRCVCNQQPCPWSWHWDEVNCNCSPNWAKKKLRSEDYYDKESVDWTLARGVMDIEASAITSTHTLFSTTDGGTIKVPATPPKGGSNSTQRFKTSSGGVCVQCEDNQTDDFYRLNGCIYTDSTCDVDKTITYYLCSTATNPVVGESQRACIPQDIKPSSGLYYDSLEGCLNSGCAGFMWCEFNASVNGVNFTEEEGEAYSPIPMCCSSVIQGISQSGYEYTYTESGPLTVDVCLADCAKGDTWFPLYNAFGTNTHMDSPLAYLTRELLLQVNVGQCTVDTTDTKFKQLGYVKKNPYS